MINMRRNGFTLIELLVAISIISILSVIGLVVYQGITAKGRDSVRKSDLNKLATALEIYYQQNNQYVVGSNNEDLATCQTDPDTGTFYNNIKYKKLMSDGVVPADPSSREAYCYVSSGNGQSYRLFAKLENCNNSGGNLCTYTNYNYSIYSDDLFLASATGDTIVAALPSSTSSTGGSTGGTTIPPASTTTYPIMVLNIKMEGEQYGAPSDKIDKMFFTGQNSIKEFYEETSKPDINSSSKVTLVNSGIHEISYPESALSSLDFNPENDMYKCNSSKVSELVHRIAKENGIDVDNFLQAQNSNVIYIFNEQSRGCNFTPHALPHLRKVFSGLSVVADFDIASDFQKTLVHELMHNILYMDHQYGLNCGGKNEPYIPTPNVIMNFSECSKSFRDDRTDLMSGWNDLQGDGNMQLPTFSIPTRIKIGWFNPQKVLEVTSSGTYTLNRLWSSEPGYEVLKIRRPSDTSAEIMGGYNVYDYYISLRNNTGFEAAIIPDDAKTGIYIHLADTTSTRTDYAGLFNYVIVSKTRPYPGMPTLYNPLIQRDGYLFGGLQAGETFTDTLDPGLRISHQLSADGKLTNVTVTFGPGSVQGISTINLQEYLIQTLKRWIHFPKFLF